MSELKVEKINLGTSTSSESPNAAIHITRDNNTSTIVIEENIDGTAGGNIDFWKTRNGAASVTDDFLGVIKWYDDKGETGVALLAVKTDTGGAGSGKMIFKTKESADSSYSTRMIIKEDGKVGIGTASPPGLLSVDGTTTTGIPGIHLSDFSSTELDIAVADGEQLQIGEWNGSSATVNAKVAANGDWYTNDGSTSSLSDERVKDNIETLDECLSSILQLRPVSFDYNGLGQMRTDMGKQRGFIAQEVELILPDIVKIDKRSDEDEPDLIEYRSMAQGKLIPYLVRAIQEQNEQIEELKSKVLELENSNI